MTFAGLLKGLLVLLVIANLAVLAAWLAPPQLRTMGVLPPVAPQYRELARVALPAPEAAAAATTITTTASAVASDAERAPTERPNAAEMPAASAPPPAESSREPPPPAGSLEPRAPPPPTAAALGCAVVGPFLDQAAAQAVRERLVAAGGSAQLQAENPVRYMVLLPPAASPAAAGETRRVLRQHGFDAYVMPAGEYRNGISVGVFESRARALAQQRRVAELGFSAELIQRQRPAAYRLLARAPPAALDGLPHTACPPAGSEHSDA